MSFLAAALAVSNPAAGGGYIEEDFTATTSGDLSDDNLTSDELGGGWLGSATDFSYQGDSSGVNWGGIRAVSAVQTDGREDVRITATMVIVRGSAGVRWPGINVRNSTGGGADGLTIRFDGGPTTPNLVIADGNPDSGAIKTWDLSGLTTPPASTDEVTLVVECEGDDITLVSMQVNGGSVETINESYTLTGGAATAHGASSGADHYGLGADRPGSASRGISILVEAL